MEGSAVDKILKQLLWEPGGYQALEFQIVNTEREERGKSDGVRGENGATMILFVVESNKPSKSAQSACLEDQDGVVSN